MDTTAQMRGLKKGLSVIELEEEDGARRRAVHPLDAVYHKTHSPPPARPVWVPWPGRAGRGRGIGRVGRGVGGLWETPFI